MEQKEILDRKFNSVEELLNDVPWLAKYGRNILAKLIEEGITSLRQFIHIPPARFRFWPGIGETKVYRLVAMQEEIRERLLGEAKKYPPITLTSTLRVLPIASRYSVRLFNSLGRLGVNTVQEALDLAPETLARAQGAGKYQVELFRQLQADLRRLLADSGALCAPHSAGDSTIIGAPVSEESRLSTEPQEQEEIDAQEPFAALPITALGEIWLSLPIALRNILQRYYLNTVGKILALAPEDFARLHGVGPVRVQAFIDLQNKLKALRDTYRETVSVTSQVAQEGTTTAKERPFEEPRLEERATSTLTFPLSFRRPSFEEMWQELLAQAEKRNAWGFASARNYNIWVRYYQHPLGAFQAEKRKTLEDLGETYGLTRERVRQIIAKFTHRLVEELQYSPDFVLFGQVVQEILIRSLGLMCVEDFAKSLQARMQWDCPPTAAELALLSRLLAKTDFPYRFRCRNGLIEHENTCPFLHQEVTQKAQAILKEIDDRLHLLDFAYELSQACVRLPCAKRGGTCPPYTCGVTGEKPSLPATYVKAILTEMAPSPLEEEYVWGYWWTQLKKARQKGPAIYAALHILGRPTHYKELLQFLCQHNPLFSASDERYVLNHLINGEEYVLTERLGTYGLAAWNVVKYETVGDRIENMLRGEQKMIPQSVIIRRLKSQGIPEGNIRAALEQQRFFRDEEGYVGLAEWATEKNKPPKPQTSLFIWEDDEPEYLF